MRHMKVRKPNFCRGTLAHKACVDQSLEEMSPSYAPQKLDPAYRDAAAHTMKSPSVVAPHLEVP